MIFKKKKKKTKKKFSVSPELQKTVVDKKEEERKYVDYSGLH